MALTKSFMELVQNRVARDPDFAAALLREGIDTMLAGDVDTARPCCAITSRLLSASKNSLKLQRLPAQKSDSYVRPTWQPTGAEPLRHHRLPTTAGRRRIACHGRTEMNSLP